MSAIIQPIKTALVHKIAPLGTNGEGPHPSLVLLHGRGADENDLLGLTPYLDPRFLIISVRAPFTFPLGGYMWYDVPEVGKPELSQLKESYHILLGFLSDIKRQLPIDAHRLFLLGFSMGAMMSYCLALTKPEEIKGVVAHSGYIPEDAGLQYQWNKLVYTSFFVAHGTNDTVIPVEFGRRARSLLSESKTGLTYREYPIAHQISDASLRDLSNWLQQRISVDS